MDPRLIVGVAQNLRFTNKPEYYRSAISRAYYAVFNVASEFLAAMNHPRAKNESHTVLHNRLVQSTVASLMEIGSTLGYFHAKRIRADYNMEDTKIESQKEANSSVALASDLIVRLDGIVRDSDDWNIAKAAIKRAKGA